LIIGNLNLLTNQTIFFITSSILENNEDWKSIFIADMLFAFSKKFRLLYCGPEGVIPKNVKNVVSSRFRDKLTTMMRFGGIARLIRTGTLLQKIYYPLMMLLSIRTSAKSNNNRFDIYFVNWLQNAVSLPNDGKDLYITVLGSDLGLLKFAIVRFLLARVFKKHRTILLPNAQWMVKPLTKYFGEQVVINVTPLGIREYWFQEVERDPIHWISVSRVTQPKVRLLFEWGTNFFSQDDRLKLVGPNQDDLLMPDWVNYVGETTLDGLLNIHYPKAKALVFLSGHNEGRPQTIIEAMASGVPVVCLDNALYREFIIDGENGFLVNNSEELRTALSKLSDPDYNKEISDAARVSIKNLIGTWDDYSERVKHIIRI